MSAFPKDSPFFIEVDPDPCARCGQGRSSHVHSRLSGYKCSGGGTFISKKMKEVEESRDARAEDMISELKDLNDWIIAEAPFGDYIDGDVLDSFVDELQARVSRLIP
jgi:hypothetical protein